VAFVPDTKTFTNSVLDSSDINAFIRDPIRFLLNKPIAELRQTVAQSLASGAWQSLTFTTEDVDTDPAGTGGHSNSVNTSRYTAVYAGWYLCSGGVGFDASAVGDRGIRWMVNGTAVLGSGVFLATSPLLTTLVPARVKRILLNLGDYLEMQAWQDTGGALNTNVSGENQSSMSIAWDRVA